MTHEFLRGSLDSAFSDISNLLDAVNMDIPNSLDKEGGVIPPPIPLLAMLYEDGTAMLYENGVTMEYEG